MDRQLAAKITSAAVGVAVIGVGAWLSARDAEHASTLILGGLAILGGLGTVALPRLTEPASSDPPRSRKRRRGGMAPPLPILLTLAMMTGCGASALSVQADAAAITGRVVAEADVALVRTRGAEPDAIVADAQAACPGGCPDRADYHEGRLADAESRWRPVLACRGPVVEGLRAWIDAIELAATAASEELGMSHVLAEAARVVLLYAGFRECVDDAADLPELPDVVLAYARGAAQ